jgi:hypothetical protein
MGFADISPVAYDGTADVPYPIRPCTCFPWHAQVVEYGEPPRTWVREWHAADCPRWKDHLTAYTADASEPLQSIFNPRAGASSERTTSSTGP